jgi:folate-binding protein YgfZ
MGTPAHATDRGYEALVHGCGLLDRSELGKLALTGEQAGAYLGGQVSNDTESLAAGHGCYAALLDNKGKMLGDLRVLRTPDGGELLLVCERASLQTLFDVLRRSIIGWQAELHKRTVQQGLVSLMGPQARALAGADAAGLGEEEHDAATARVADADVLLVATDTGVDVVCDAGDTPGVVAALLGAGAVQVDEAEAEIRRVELGRPRFGADLAGGVIPQEAGLNERAVSFTKGCYVGQETVARLFYRGKPNRHLRGLRLAEPVAPGAVLHALPADGGDAPGRRLGEVTSAVVSPAHGPIALAFVRREAEVGDTVAVGTTTGVVSDLPF